MKYLGSVIFAIATVVGVCVGRNWEYLVRVEDEWIDEVKQTAHKFGLKFEYKVVLDVYLFTKVSKSRMRRHVDEIKRFKEYFGNKVIKIERRPNVQVRYAPLVEMLMSSPKEQYKQLFIQRNKTATLNSCWPYYGMGVQQAWAMGYTGRGVTVAVVDNGVDMNHPDLVKNLAKNLSFNFIRGKEDDTNPQHFHSYWEVEDVTSHGTMSAGLIGAEFGNEACSAGIAYNATLSVLKVFETEDTPELWMLKRYPYSARWLPLALSYKTNEIDIYSCSFNTLGEFQEHAMDIMTALIQGIQQGRQRRGSIFVFSSGNKLEAPADCNVEAFASSIYTITISSVGILGSLPKYARHCAPTLASTYGDYIKFIGYKRLESTRQNGYCGDFFGTSASAAIASGMIAQALQANPYLTWRDVQYVVVLSSTLEQIDESSMVFTNGVGLKYNHFFGFGLMNATSMTLLAKKWKTVPPQLAHVAVASNVVYGRLHSKHILVRTAEYKCENKDCIQYLEYVGVEVQYETSLEGFFDIIVCSSLRTCSFVYKNNHSDSLMTVVERKWNFSSSHFWGENPQGKWHILFVINNMGRDSIQDLVKWKSARVLFYGTANNPYSEDYIISNFSRRTQFTAVDSEIDAFLNNLTSISYGTEYTSTTFPTYVKEENIQFSWPGVIIFTAVLLVCVFIVAYLCIKKYIYGSKDGAY